jgi:hypothetical protein
MQKRCFGSAMVTRASRRDGNQWTRTRAWTKALLAFKIQFGDRLPDTAI